MAHILPLTLMVLLVFGYILAHSDFELERSPSVSRNFRSKKYPFRNHVQKRDVNREPTTSSYRENLEDFGEPPGSPKDRPRTPPINGTLRNNTTNGTGNRSGSGNRRNSSGGKRGKRCQSSSNGNSSQRQEVPPGEPRRKMRSNRSKSGSRRVSGNETCLEEDRREDLDREKVPRRRGPPSSGRGGVPTRDGKIRRPPPEEQFALFDSSKKL